MAREPGSKAARWMMVAIAIGAVLALVLLLTFRGREDNVSRSPAGVDAGRSQ